jgi:hypothetical protein
MLAVAPEVNGEASVSWGMPLVIDWLKLKLPAKGGLAIRVFS